MTRHVSRDAGEGSDRVRRLIASVRRRWFATVALRAIGMGAAVAALPALAAGLVYWLLGPRDVALLMLTAVAAALAIAGVVVVARGIERRPDDRRVARFIEERAERRAGSLPMDDSVVSAVQAMEVPASDERAPFAALVVTGAVRCLEGVTPGALIPAADLRRAAGIAVAGFVLLAGTLAATAPALSQVSHTARLRLFPGAVTVHVDPGDVRLVAGSPVTIRARFQAGGSALAPDAAKLVVSAGDDERSVEMTPTADGFAFEFDSVDRTFQYHVMAGAVTSSRHTVTALFAPRVKRIEIDYEYPSFSGLTPRTEEDGGDIYAPAGTKVRLRVHADKPLAAAELALSRSNVAFAQSADQVVEADLVLARDDSYRIRLTDRDGLRSAGDSEYFIRLMDDRPPDVRIVRPGGDQGITPLEEVAIEARAEDDYGVASLELVYSVAGGKERVVPFTGITGGDTQWTGTYLLPAEDLNVRPGDVITYYAQARDIGRGKRSTQTRSDIFFLEVKPFSEEFVAAQSQAGAGGGGDPQIESLIEAQKEIISATWNIERRAAAGRSNDDMQAVAAAQAELKARAERTLAGRGRRGRDFAPQRVLPSGAQGAPQPSGDTIAAAIEAMHRAAEQLAAGKTAEAIPHEMAALSGLLKLQAEVRRRQVTQQQANASGGGWGNRQTQDLTALFDKELQRQQRTNYEQRSSVEERGGQRDSEQETLDRIRDLARRQEALNREQREAAQLAADERRRQLEKLMREQEELRRQAEDLAKQMSGQRQSGQQQSGQQQSGQQQSGQQEGQRSGQPQQGQQAGGTQGMRAAVEQMRQAAGDLSREDGESAARRGERAAEQLRQLEEQLRGGSADARQREAADLQAGAQQILQEQRRIAAETERLEKGGEAGTADARRRLAADKDRLADRVDDLQGQADRLGRQKGTSGEQTRAREAAGQLEKERVGERMREGAAEMRQGQSGAQAEQQLARTLEQVVDRLGGAGPADLRQTADQLDQSRQLRERLDRLEAEMRQAEARGDSRAEELRQQYAQELRQAQASLGRQGGGRTDQRGDAGGATPERQEFSRSAPGTEAFKQDRSAWESLRKDIDQALDERDMAASRRLSKVIAEDRLSAGGSERVPDEYRRLIARYYESLGKVRK